MKFYKLIAILRIIGANDLSKQLKQAVKETNLTPNTAAYTPLKNITEQSPFGEQFNSFDWKTTFGAWHPEHTSRHNILKTLQEIDKKNSPPLKT